jgi:hypothetical protein
VFVCLESGFRETTFQIFLCLFAIRKLVNGRYFPVKGKFGLIFRKVFFFYFGWKTLSRSYEKFINIILFVDYIKFGHQTFDCHIYFVFIFMIVFAFFLLLFLIEIFYLQI